MAGIKYLTNIDLFSICGLTTSDIERIQSQRTQSKLPNLTIYDLLEEGFKTEPEKEPYIRHIKSEPDHYTHYTKKNSDGLRCTSQDMPTRGLPNVGPRFGLLDDRKLARRVGNDFPGFFKLASHIDPIYETENTIPTEKPEKERKIGKPSFRVSGNISEITSFREFNLLITFFSQAQLECKL